MTLQEYSLSIDREDANSVRLVKESVREYGRADSLAGPRELAEMMESVYRMSERADEYMYLIVTDAASHPLGVFELSHGTACTAECDPRGVFMRILLCGGVAFALVHNHPSGDTEPSREDFNVCRRMNECAKMMGVVLNDFIITGTNNAFHSFLMEGELKRKGE